MIWMFVHLTSWKTLPFLVKKCLTLKIAKNIFWNFVNRNPAHICIRYSSLSFNICADSVLHGFGGYFECYLYKKIMISILPATHSPGMFSWFPILFPLKDTIQLKKNDNLKLHFWRNVTKTHVWWVLNGGWAVLDILCQLIDSLIDFKKNFWLYLERAHPAFLTTLVVLVLILHTKSL